MAQAKMVFSYLGPVRVYDDITTNKWGGTTMAVSEKQARNNLAHQYPDKSPEDSTITYHWLKETWSKEGPRAVGMNIQ